MHVNVFGEIAETELTDEIIKKWVCDQTGMKNFEGNTDLIDKLHSTMFWCVRRGYELSEKLHKLKTNPS